MTRNYKNKRRPVTKKTRWQKIKAVLRKAEHVALAKVVVLGHGMYYGLVALEAHGRYRYAAGALLVFLILEVLTNEGGGEV